MIPEPETASPAVAPPPGNPRFALMDAARGAAALLIVVAHSFGGPLHSLLTDLVQGLAAAVQVFFALSGFLLFRPYVAARAAGRPEPRPLDFLRRRALRILPAYWLALLVGTLALGSVQALGHDWWRYFGFLQVYSLSHSGGGIPVAWTLCVEVAFYATLPLLALASRALARRWGWQRAALAVIALMIVIGPLIHLLNTLPLDRSIVLFVARTTYALPGELNFFAVGMAVAVASVHAAHGGRLPRGLRALIARPLLAWGLAAGLWLIAATVCGFARPIGGLDFRTRFVGTDLLITVFVGLILLPLAFDERPGPVRRAMSLRPVAFAGLVSYGLYLWHVPLAGWLGRWAPVHWAFTERHVAVQWPLTALILLSTGLATATASYYLVELPFLRRKPGFTGDRGPRGRARHARPEASLPAPRNAPPHPDPA